LFILVGVSIVIFTTMRLVPGDPIVYLAGPFATAKQRAAIRESYGLDKPVVVQYGRWLAKAAQGDLGRSMQLHVPVTELLFGKLRNTLLLVAGSMFIAILVGWSLGILSGFRPNGLIDRIGLVVALAGISLPAFWFGMLLIIAFAINLPWFPANGIVSERGDGGVFDVLWHLFLPAVATAALPCGVMLRMTRTAVLEIRRMTFVRALAAKGLPGRALAVHVIWNALPNILNVTGMQAGFLLTAAIFSEVVFSWPGLGLQIYAAVTSQDYTVAQGAVLFICILFLLFNVVVDVLRPIFDPRIRMA
jgi:peptide/nickel transport system permease protein